MTTSSWSAFVVGDGINPSGDTAVMVIEPDTIGLADQIRPRLTRAGFQHITPAELDRGRWPVASPTCRIYLAPSDGGFAYFHTGDARFAPTLSPMRMTERWIRTARARRRAAFVLVAPGTMPDLPDGTHAGEDDDATRSCHAAMLEAAARRGVIAGIALVGELPS
jgi:hypothetical protein